MRTRRWESEFIVTFSVDLPSCAVPPKNDTVVGAHFGRAGQGPKMHPGGECIRRLVKTDGGGWVRVRESQ